MSRTHCPFRVTFTARSPVPGATSHAWRSTLPARQRWQQCRGDDDIRIAVAVTVAAGGDRADGAVRLPPLPTGWEAWWPPPETAKPWLPPPRFLPPATDRSARPPGHVPARTAQQPPVAAREDAVAWPLLGGWPGRSVGRRLAREATREEKGTCWEGGAAARFPRPSRFSGGQTTHPAAGASPPVARRARPPAVR